MKRVSGRVKLVLVTVTILLIAVGTVIGSNITETRPAYLQRDTGPSKYRQPETPDGGITATDAESPTQGPHLASEGNLVLYVSNQSFDVDPIEITIEIDGVQLIDQAFEVESQHNWQEFVVQLSPGSHTLKARSPATGAVLVEDFVLEDRHWAVVDFWYHDGSSGSPVDPMFTFHTDDKPIRFQ